MQRATGPRPFTFAAAALLLAGCAQAPWGAPPPQRGSAIGAVLGSGTATAAYLPGDLVGGRQARTARALRAGIPPVAPAEVRGFADRLDAELRRQTAGTGVEVIRQGNELLLRLPASISFDVGSAAPKAQVQATLAEVGRSLQTFRSTLVDVLGHTDDSGTAAANQRLSVQRADAVAAALARRGVSRARMATRGYGESLPVASNATEYGRAANRRVEIRIVPLVR
jgi:outer membrane protein OmpA-like peptidoglycan-associated protein